MNSIIIQAKYRLGRITNKYLIVDVIFSSFFRKNGFAYIHQASKILRQLWRDNFKAALALSEDVLEHIYRIPCEISTVALPETGGSVQFVLLSGDRLYTSAEQTLYVYSLSDFTSPIATDRVYYNCWSGLITNDLLFLGEGSSNIIVYKLSRSIAYPL